MRGNGKCNFEGAGLREEIVGVVLKGRGEERK